MAAKRILVAEDEEQNKMLIDRMLRKLGQDNFTIVSDGLEVLEIMQREVFDLLILDVSMPRLNGIDAARTIKQNGGYLSGDIPIVILSGNSPEYLTNICKIEKIDFFISKPFRFNDLNHIFTKLDFI